MTQDSISNKLSELFDLYKSGALTKEEYDQLKAKIINKDVVQPIIEKVQEKEPDFEAKKEIVIEQLKELNDKDLVSNQSIVKPVTKPVNKLGKKIIIAIVVCILIVVSIELLVNKNTLFSGKSGLTGQKIQTVKDVDGNAYETVTIGKQVWMAENLRTTKYNDGTAIPLITVDKAWEALNTPAYCWYNNDANTDSCGALYNWYTVSTNKLCPKGWHVPTDVEWAKLIDYLGGEDVAGGKLKERGTTHWKKINLIAAIERGCVAARDISGAFPIVSFTDAWWSSTEFSTTDAYIRYMRVDGSEFSSNNVNKRYGLTVRCLRD